MIIQAICNLKLGLTYKNSFFHNFPPISPFFILVRWYFPTNYTQIHPNLKKMNQCKYRIIKNNSIKSSLLKVF